MKYGSLKPFIPVAVFLLAIFLTIMLVYVPFPNLIRLDDSDYPCQEVPTIVTPGGDFKLYVDADRVWAGERELEIEEGVVRIPQDLSLGWHDIALQVGGTTSTRPDSLYVTPFDLQDYTFIQITDMHTSYYEGADIEERRGVIDLVNDMGPAFVVDTGDMTNYGLEKQYILYESIISGLDVPLYTIPGNMETYSDHNLERYAEHLGPSNYYFYIGDTLFVAGAALHAPRSWGGFDDEQLEWLDENFAREAALKIFLQHTPIVSEEGRDYKYIPWGWKDGHFSQVEQGYDRIVDILTREKAVTLSGHWHTYSNIFEYKGATFYQTPSVTWMSGVKKGPRFRLFRIQDGEITFDKVIEYKRFDISREYGTDNTQVTVNIRNDHEFPVPLNVHVKLSPSSFPYKTDTGEIMASTSSGDVWVRYDAPPGESEIRVTPVT